MREDEKTIGLGATLAGICFAIVIAWALVSVLELTGTLTSATQIKSRVKVINSKLGPIHYNLSFIKYAGMVANETTEINAAAKPLSGQLTTILATANSIGKKVQPILANATAINGVVKQINQNALAINANVLAIGASVQSIGGHVSSIGGSVASINSSVNSIGSRVSKIDKDVGPIGTNGNGITADLTRTDNDFAGILTAVHQIQPGLVTISSGVTTIENLVTGIKSDFDGILTNVGTEDGTATVVGHANSIDCSQLIDLLGKTADCGLVNKS